MKLLLLLLATALSLAAQISSTGQIVGSVQDSSGAAIPGVSLKLTNANTGNAQTMTAKADGGFVFNTLPPGTYNLSASLKGFETAVYSGIVVDAARTTNQLVTMKVGAVN